MAQYDIPISMPGGFKSMADAKAHRSVVGRLQQMVDISRSTAQDLKDADRVEVGKTGSDLYTDLAPGQGHVIMLSQPEGRPLMGAELRYNPADGQVRSLQLDLGESKLDQQGQTFKLEEQGTTTYFKLDEQRGVFTVLDTEAQVPRIFGDANPQSLIGGTLQLNSPILIY